MKLEELTKNRKLAIDQDAELQVRSQGRRMVFTQWLGVPLAFITLLLLIPTPVARAIGIGQTICIDAGHGGKEPGKINQDLKEKDLALEIAKNLEKKLNKASYHVEMTRRTDTYLGNSERAIKCNNAGAAVLLSIHLNATAISRDINYTSTIFGTETKQKDQAFATTIFNALHKFKANKNDTMLDQSAGILLTALMPATIAEVVFLSSDKEYNLFKNEKDKRIEQIARALFNGLETWFAAPEQGPVPVPTPFQQPDLITCPLDPNIMGARFYQKGNYQGFCGILGPGEYKDLARYGLSGKIGSIWNNSGYEIALFDQTNLQGNSISFPLHAQTLPDNWGSRVRSMYIVEPLADH